MEINSKWSHGYTGMRDHEIEVDPALRQVVVGCRVILQTDEGLNTDVDDYGDLTGWVFWEANEQIINVSTTENGNENISEIAEDNLLGSRKECPVSKSNENGIGAKTTSRLLGAWMSSSVCVVTDQGLLPILDKDGNVENNFTPKILFSGTKPNGIDEKNIARFFGETPSPGTIGILFQGSSPDEFEYIFLSVQSQTGLIVDHNSDKGLSTNIFTTKNDGSLDQDGCHVAALDSIFDVRRDENNAKVVGLLGDQSGKDITGHIPIVWREIDRLSYLSNIKGGPISPGIDNSPNNIIPGIGGACIDTDAVFLQEQNLRAGRLKFTSQVFPTTPEQLENIVESSIVFDVTQRQWRIITDKNQDLKLSLAKVRWDFDGDNDLSECLVFGEEENFLGWVDARKSLLARFQSAGNEAIFVVRIIAEEEIRQGESRPLFLVETISTEGKKFTFVKRRNFTQGFILFSGEKPWNNELVSLLTTNINGDERENVLPISLTSEWNPIPLNDGDNLWLEIVQLDRGIPFLCCPIRPTLLREDENFSLWESLEDIEVGSIAKYELIREKVQDGMLNTMFPGSTPINRYVPSNSFSFQTKNTDHSIAYRILSYDESTGIIEAIPLWDNKLEKRLNIAAFSGRDKAKSSVVSKYDIYFAQRVGNFNGNGFDVPELELQDDQNGFSWISFFFDLESCPTLTISLPFISRDAEITRSLTSDSICLPDGFVLPDGDFIQETNLSTVLTFNIFSNNRINDVLSGEEKVYILNSVVLASVNDLGSCESIEAGSIFSGESIGIGANDSSAILIVGAGVNFYTSVCCDADPAPDPDPDPVIEKVIVQGFNVNGVLQFSHGMQLRETPIISGGRENHTLPTSFPGTSLLIEISSSTSGSNAGVLLYRASSGTFGFTRVGGISPHPGGVVGTYVGQVFSTSVPNSLRNTRVVIVSPDFS